MSGFAERFARSATPRFLASRELAELVLQNNGPRQDTLFPFAERLDVAPHTPAAGLLRATAGADPAFSEDAVERTRATIGARLERLLATLAWRAAAEGLGQLRLSDEQQFVPVVGHELLQRLPVAAEAAGTILARLFEELRQFARARSLDASWGRLTDRPEGLVLELEPFERDLLPRSRARPLDPT